MKRNDNGYILVSTLYVLLFIGLALNLTSIAYKNQISYYTQLEQAYLSKAAINIAFSLTQKELDQGRQIKKGELDFNLGRVSITDLGEGMYQAEYTGKYPEMTKIRRLKLSEILEDKEADQQDQDKEQ